MKECGHKILHGIEKVDKDRLLSGMQQERSIVEDTWPREYWEAFPQRKW